MKARVIACISFALLCTVLPAADEAGKIMRPVDGAAMPVDKVDIIATAPAGKLELDGKAVTADQPFPDVFHTTVKASAGTHSLVLTWDGGRKEVRFFVGPNPPAEFQPYREHPPVADVQCTQCHELSKRGRFRFKIGCFDCHQNNTFAKVHTHDSAVLRECGSCHNAHGSTAKALLLYPKETACKLCHN
jgi:predicted CXXCH cytochrome family protein